MSSRGAGIAGSATAEGTARCARRHVGSGLAATSTRSAAGLAQTTIGLGTYLGKDDDATDALYLDAVTCALCGGIGVVDTAINYRSQRSERVVGAALRRLIVEEQTLARDEVLIASKAGFLPFDGARPTNARAFFEETYVRPGLLRWEDVVSGCHSLAPRFLLDQLERSRRNLGLETIDVYYLHNPEMELDETPRPTFLRRVRAAFEVLERAVQDGKIRAYGTATWNGYREPQGGPAWLSLPELLALAREVAGDAHHLRYVQLPLNLAQREALELKNQPRDGRALSLLEAALGEVQVMTSASIHQGKHARGLSPTLAAELPGLDTDAQRALQLVRSLPGMGTALVGMKSAAHVAEALGVLRTEPLAPSAAAALFSLG